MAKLINNHQMPIYKLFSTKLKLIWSNLIIVGAHFKEFMLCNSWKYKYKQEVLYLKQYKQTNNLHQYKYDKK